MSQKCFSCMYYNEWYERHPYGSTYATEHMSECLNEEGDEDIIAQVMFKGSECPFWEEKPEDPRIARDEEDKYYESIQRED